MKKASQLIVFTVLGWSLSAQAGPMGPSAKMAARLKKQPTSAWLAHYLPDDRYKIAGGIWKYVSTDLDTYYHRPNSPLMMRQSAGRVIGFSSAAEAEEAGYKPGPGLAPRVEVGILGNNNAVTGGRNAVVSGDSSVDGSSTRPLSGTEVVYLRKLGRLVNAFGAFQKMKSQGPSMSRTALLAEARGAFILMQNAPIPPRFAYGGQKVKEGARFLNQVIDQIRITKTNTVPAKDVYAAGASIGLGMVIVQSEAGKSNFDRYVDLKSMLKN